MFDNRQNNVTWWRHGDHSGVYLPHPASGTGTQTTLRQLDPLGPPQGRPGLRFNLGSTCNPQKGR